MKKCPFCAEQIQDEAIKCKHCGEFINETESKPAEIVPPDAPGTDAKLVSPGPSSVFGCGTFCAAAIVIAPIGLALTGTGIGAILGVPLLIGAAAYFVKGMDELSSKWHGACPACGKPCKAVSSKRVFDCACCKKRLAVKKTSTGIARFTLKLESAPAAVAKAVAKNAARKTENLAPKTGLSYSKKDLLIATAAAYLLLVCVVIARSSKPDSGTPPSDSYSPNSVVRQSPALESARERPTSPSPKNPEQIKKEKSLAEAEIRRKKVEEVKRKADQEKKDAEERKRRHEEEVEQKKMAEEERALKEERDKAFHGAFALSHLKWKSEGSIGYITGDVKNISDRSYRYVQVEINLEDDDRKIVGSALANMNNLGPGRTWQFRALVSEDRAHSFTVKDISGF